MPPKLKMAMQRCELAPAMRAVLMSVRIIVLMSMITSQLGEAALVA